MPIINKDMSLLLQCLASTSLLAELSNADFINSDYFKLLKFENEGIKNILVKSGIGNPAIMQMMLYALLVVPKETLSKSAYKLLDLYVKRLNPSIYRLIETDGTRSTYNGESNIKDIDYLRHIRNAVAHSNCKYFSKDGKNLVIFIDKNKHASKKCSIKIECYKVGTILMDLQGLIMDYYSKTYQNAKSIV